MCTLSGPECLSWVDTPLILCLAFSSLTAWAAPVSKCSSLGEGRLKACLLEVVGAPSLSPAASCGRHLAAQCGKVHQHSSALSSTLRTARMPGQEASSGS